jgi:hypothetical protein
MYQVLFPEGQLECARSERTDNGVELFDDEETFVAFVPYENLHALIHEDATEETDEPSVM